MSDVDQIPPEKLEPLRAALAAMVREGVDLSVRRLRERAEAKMQHAQLVLAAYRAGKFPLEVPRPAPAPPPAGAATLEPQAHGGALLRHAPAVITAPPPEGDEEPLDVLVAGVDSHEKHVRACQRVAREMARGRLDVKAGNAILDALKETRQGIKGAAQEGVEEVEELLPCTREAAELVGVFEGITSDERRARVLAMARAELAADELEGPRALGKSADAEPEGARPG